MAARGPIKAILAGYNVSGGILSLIQNSSSASVSNDVTLTPAGTDNNGVSWWEERSGGIRIGYPTFSLSHRKPTKTSRVDRVSAKIVLPILESPAGDDSNGFTPAPQVAYTVSGTMDFILPERSSATDRSKFLALFASVLSAAVQATDGSPNDATGSPLSALVINLDDVY